MRVLVKGAGVAGLTVAWQLYRHGFRVTLAELADKVGAGASGFAGGMLAPWCERESAEEPVLTLGRLAADWWEAALPGHVKRRGTLVVAGGRDAGELERFSRRTNGWEWLDEQAIAALEEVIRKYPNSEYATTAKKKIEGARDQLAGREMTIGRYYMDKRDYTGAINRFKVVVTQYQTTRHVEEALARLTEAYMAIGVVSEAQTAAAVLGHNFPDSRWYKDAYNLVKSGGVEPQENKGSYISKAFKKFGLG